VGEPEFSRPPELGDLGGEKDLCKHRQDLRNSVFKTASVGAHSCAPLLYMVLVHKS